MPLSTRPPFNEGRRTEDKGAILCYRRIDLTVPNHAADPVSEQKRSTPGGEIPIWGTLDFGLNESLSFKPQERSVSGMSPPVSLLRTHVFEIWSDPQTPVQLRHRTSCSRSYKCLWVQYDPCGHFSVLVASLFSRVNKRNTKGRSPNVR